MITTQPYITQGEGW